MKLIFYKALIWMCVLCAGCNICSAYTQAGDFQTAKRDMKKTLDITESFDSSITENDLRMVKINLETCSKVIDLMNDSGIEEFYRQQCPSAVPMFLKVKLITGYRYLALSSYIDYRNAHAQGNMEKVRFYVDKTYDYCKKAIEQRRQFQEIYGF